MNQHNAPKPDAEIAMAELFDGIDLVIFDFDGVIADSEMISLGSLQQALSAHGIEVSFDEVQERFLGTSLARICAFVEERTQKPAKSFAEDWESALFARFRAELTPLPAVTRVVDDLASKGRRYCIASSGTLQRIGVALSAMDLTDRFPLVFSAEQVTRGKPEPDLFLHAAGQVGVRPEKCIVIEDSPFGVRAARAAQMRCAGFIGGAHLRTSAHDHAECLRQLGADPIIRSFEMLR